MRIKRNKYWICVSKDGTQVFEQWREGHSELMELYRDLTERYPRANLYQLDIWTYDSYMRYKRCNLRVTNIQLFIKNEPKII